MKSKGILKNNKIFKISKLINKELRIQTNTRKDNAHKGVKIIEGLFHKIRKIKQLMKKQLKLVRNFPKKKQISFMKEINNGV